MAKPKAQNSPPPSPPNSSHLSSTTTADVALNYTASSAPNAYVNPVNNTLVDKNDSISSRNISISSINEDDNNDSSTFENSDSECDDEQIKKAIECIPRTLQPGSQLVQNGMLVVKNGNESPVSAKSPNIGSIAVQNSSDITFGNKTYIKGQVVIKNIYPDRKEGAVNQGYYENDGELGASQPKKELLLDTHSPQSWQSSLKSVIRNKPLLSVIAVIALILIIITIVVAVVAGSSEDDFLHDAKPLRIVTRNQWLAQPPKEKLDQLELPVQRVIIAHTATEGCTTQAFCTFLTSNIQIFHMAADSKNYSDIAYNFLVGGDGNAYEGRSWDNQGSHTKGFNKGSICIAFIGTFTDVAPPLTQLSAAQQLIEEGLALGKIAKNYRLYGHRQLAPFESPGRILYEIIKKWPHWSNELSPSHFKE